jgi:outer membrane scaffolding protein for murein synthesis (MipA/OmpV family)
MLGVIVGYDLLANPQQDLALEVEVPQDVANDNGFLGTVRGLYGGRSSTSLRLDAFVETTWASEDYMSPTSGSTPRTRPKAGSTSSTPTTM